MQKTNTYLASGLQWLSPTAPPAYLLVVAGAAASLLAPGGAGTEPLDFFGTTAPLLTVVLKGKVCTSGLAGRQAEMAIRTFPFSRELYRTIMQKEKGHPFQNASRVVTGTKTTLKQ